MAVLQDGRLVALGSPEETITAALLARVYGVSVDVVRLPETGRLVCVPTSERS